MAQEIEALTPYARSLGITVESWEDGIPILSVPFEETVEGRPEHYHGGATGGLLETAGYAALRAELRAGPQTGAQDSVEWKECFKKPDANVNEDQPAQLSRAARVVGCCRPYLWHIKVIELQMNLK